MSNEAAERMRVWIGETGIEGESELFEKALAAERKATVKRIRAAALAKRKSWNMIGLPPSLEAILDAEAAR